METRFFLQAQLTFSWAFSDRMAASMHAISLPTNACKSSQTSGLPWFCSFQVSFEPHVLLVLFDQNLTKEYLDDPNRPISSMLWRISASLHCEKLALTPTLEGSFIFLALNNNQFAFCWFFRYLAIICWFFRFSISFVDKLLPCNFGLPHYLQTILSITIIAK